MEKFIKELVECRMQLLRDKHGQHLVFNYMCLTDFHNDKPSIYVGFEDGLGQVWDELLSSFGDWDFAQDVYELLAKLYPSAHQYIL